MEMRLKNSILIVGKLTLIAGLIVYLPTKVTNYNAQVINAIDSTDSQTVALNTDNSDFVATKDKIMHIYNTH